MSYFSFSYNDRSKNQAEPYFANHSNKDDFSWGNAKKQLLYSNIPEKPNESLPKIDQNSMIRESSWGFFNNPKSEWEDKRKAIADEYKKEMQARYQEKLERDKQNSKIDKQRYIENQNFSYSVKNQPKPIKEPETTLYYNRSYIGRNANNTPEYQPLEKFSYHSPQIIKKYNQSPQAIQPKEPSSDNSYLVSKANITSEQNKSIREKQLQEWRKAVQEQLDEKTKIKEEEKSRKMIEDKIEEARIKREVEELNKKYQKELRYEGSKVENEKPETPVQYKPKFVPRPVAVEEKEQEKIKEPIYFKPEKRHIFKKQDDYKSQHSLILQESGIKDIISKIRSEAYHAAAERQEILVELEKMRTELKNTRIFQPVTSVFPNVYRPPENVYPQLYNAGRQIINNRFKNAEELHGSSKQLKYFKGDYSQYETFDNRSQMTVDSLFRPQYKDVDEEITETKSVFVTQTEKPKENEEIEVKVDAEIETEPKKTEDLDSLKISNSIPEVENTPYFKEENNN